MKIAKNGHQVKAIDLAKSSLFGQTLKMQKNMLKTFLQHITIVLCKKTARKNSLYSKNESNLKIAKNGHQAKAIAFAKSSLFGQTLKMQKNMLKTFLQHTEVVLCKKRFEKTANIRKMRAFLKLPKIAENGHQAKAIGFAKSSLWVKN